MTEMDRIEMKVDTTKKSLLLIVTTCELRGALTAIESPCAGCFANLPVLSHLVLSRILQIHTIISILREETKTQN